MSKVNVLIFILGVVMSGCVPIRSGVPYGGSPYRDPATMSQGEIMHLATGFSLTHDQFFDMVSVNRILYVGESHDNIYDHQMELEIIKNLYQRYPGKITVGIEMFSRKSQSEIDRWIDGNLTEKEFIRLFAANWGVYDYIYYRDIFQFIKEQRIPLLALNANKEESMTTTEKKIDSQGSRFGNYEDSYQQHTLSALFLGHEKGSDDYRNFATVQELWEDTMTDSIVTFLTRDEGKDKKMIVITGRFHVAYGFGIPRRVFQRLKIPYSIILSFTPEELVENERQLMDVDFPELPLYRAEYLWCIPYRNLKDQQVKLGGVLREENDKVSIVSVVDEGAAHRAGLLSGDQINTLDGQRISSILDLQMLLIQKKPGDHAVINVIRNNNQLQLPIYFRKKVHNK